jgi:hypothetical protein
VSSSTVESWRFVRDCKRLVKRLVFVNEVVYCIVSAICKRLVRGLVFVNEVVSCIVSALYEIRFCI